MLTGLSADVNIDRPSTVQDGFLAPLAPAEGPLPALQLQLAGGAEKSGQISQVDVVSPFHWISTPIIGLTLGEIFFLAELAEDCAEGSAL